MNVAVAKSSPQVMWCFLLFAGLLTIANVSLGRALHAQGQMMAVAGGGLPMTVELSPTASVSQIEYFTRALIALPQVIDVQVPSARSVAVTLRSSEDAQSFLTFLERPELISILMPAALWELPKARDAFLASMVAEREAWRFSMMIAGGSLLLLMCVYLLFLQIRCMNLRRSLELLTLFGARELRKFLPIMREGMMILFSACAVSLVLTFVVALFSGWSVDHRFILWMCAEWFLLVGIAWGSLAIHSFLFSSRV